MPASLLPTDARAAFDAPLADREGALGLALLPRVGPRTWLALMTAHEGDADAAAAAHPSATPDDWRVARRSARSRLAQAAAAGFALHLPGDVAYPRSLLDLADPPVTFYTIGDAQLMSRAPRVAVVGTRQYTALGERSTRRLVSALADVGAVIVSGLARGIDTVAHAAALAEGLLTVAVLGTGIDVAYPAQNAALYRRIAAEGCVAAESAPGTTATPGAFPRRNRIVAALADVTVVMEAGLKSGALITAGIAADLGRPVAAMPGSVEAPTAAGTNLLLRDGAHVLADVRDVLGLLGASTSAPAARPGPEPIDLNEDERLVWQALATPAPDADALAERVGLGARRCAVALATLELRTLVATDPTGELRRPF